MTYAQTPTASPQDFGRVAVFMGGWSAEREVSLKSGQQVLQGLLAAGVDAVPVDVDRAQLKALRREDYDRVFMILHGTGGEDGVVQAHLELLGMPYTGSSVLGSALAMSKLHSKHIFRGLGLPTPEWRVARNLEACQAASAAFGLPVVIKPASEGSSIGVTLVMHAEQLESAFHQARQYGEVMVEQFVHGRELTVAVLGGQRSGQGSGQHSGQGCLGRNSSGHCSSYQALPVIHIETPREFYDYDAKYRANSTAYHCPAALPEDVTHTCQKMAEQAFVAVGARDWGRVDFMYGDDGQLWLIEVNTAPGMTDHSLVPMAAREIGLSFEALVVRILQCSLERDQ